MTGDPVAVLQRELARALACLAAADYERVIDGLSAADADELLRHLGSSVPRRFMTQGVGAHLARRAQAMSPPEGAHLARVIACSTLGQVAEGHEPDATASGIAEAVLAGCQGPSAVPLARVCLLHLASCRPQDQAELLDILVRDPRLSPPWPVEAQVATVDRYEAGRVRDLHAIANHGLSPNHAASSPGSTEAEVAHGWSWRASTSLGDIGDRLFEVDGLFTGLDRALLKSAVAVYAGVVGAASPEAFRRTVDEFVHLSVSRPSSYFLHGFTAALDPDLPAPAESELDGERRRWLLFGQLAGHINAGNRHALAQLCLAHRLQVAELVAHPLQGDSIVGGVVRALMEEHAPVAAVLLRARRHDFAGSWELYRDVYGWARVLVVTERAAEADALFAGLQELPLHDPDAWTLQQRRADLLRRRVTCKRSLVDFPSAEAMLDQVDLQGLDDRSVAALDAERGLVAVRAQHLRHVTFASETGDASGVVERLSPGRKHWEEALQHNPDDVRACFCLGVLLAADGEPVRAAALLERAEAGLIADPVLSETGMLERTRFHRALVGLQALQPGTDSAGVDALVRALDMGYRPPVEAVVDATESLQAHQSAQTGRFLARAAASLDASWVLAPLVAGLVAAHHDLDDLAEQLAADPAVAATLRFDLLKTLVRKVGRAGGTGQDQVVEMIEELLVEACSTGLEERWERLLREDEGLRQALEPAEADMLRVPVLQRLGRLDDARGVVTMLFYRAAQGGLPRYDPYDLLQFVSELGGAEQEVARLAQALGPRPADNDVDAETRLPSPVHVVFAGGNETQAQHQQEIEERLADKYGPALRVTWFTPGWGKNWMADADRVEAVLPSADALVILTYMRTNLGRYLRRAASAHDVVWRSCTGQGRVSMELSIDSAVRGVLDRAHGQPPGRSVNAGTPTKGAT